MPSQPLSVISLKPQKKTPEVDADSLIEPPEWLSEHGRSAWERLAPYLSLTPTDVDEFAAYCESISEFREATEVISEAGLLIIDPASGMPVPNPITGVRDRADRKIAAWAARFRG